MLLIAIRNLLQEKTRLLISVGGVSFAIVLMLTLIGIYQGAVSQFTKFIEKNPTDLVISRQGITDFFHGASLIPISELSGIAQEAGVEKVVPMIAQRAIIESEGKKYDLFVPSLDPANPLGAPWSVLAGKRDPGPGEIVISSVLAEKINKQLGDIVRIGDADLKITGLAEEASSLGTHYGWVSLDQAREMTGRLDLANFAYVTLANPEQATQMASRLQEKHPNLSVLEKQSFIANNRAEIEESFLPIIQAIVAIAILIGIAVIGLTIYTATLDKAREYGILKAIGVTNRQLYRIVLTQAAVSSVLGLLLGIGLSLLFAEGLSRWIDLPPEITTESVGVVTALGIGMAALASLLPIRRLVRIDPAEVFKA